MNYTDAFELKPELKAAIKKLGYENDVVALDGEEAQKFRETEGLDDTAEVGKLTPEVAAELSKTYDTFMHGDYADKMLKGAEQSAQEWTKEWIAKNANLPEGVTIEVEASSRVQDNYVGSNAGGIFLELTLFKDGKEIDSVKLEPGALYADMGDSIEIEGTWNWLFWLAADISPFQDDTFVDMYKYHDIVSALDQFSALDRTGFEFDLEKEVQKLVGHIETESVQQEGAVMEGKKKAAEFEIEDIGLESSSYFQGRGTMHTDWDEVSVGVGSTPEEALDDAAESLVQNDWDLGKDFDKEATEYVEKSKDIVVGTNVTISGKLNGKEVASIDDTQGYATLIGKHYHHSGRGAEERDVKEGSELEIGDGSFEFTMTLAGSRDDVVQEFEDKLVDAGGQISAELMDRLNRELFWLDESEHYYHVAIYVKEGGHKVDDDETKEIETESKKGAAVSDEEFWRFVKDVDWEKNGGAHEKIAKDLLKKYGKDKLLDLYPTFKRIKQELHDVVYAWTEKHPKNDLPYGGDDSFSDMLDHAIGMGKAFYMKAKRNPEVLADIEPVEAFTYIFPLGPSGVYGEQVEATNEAAKTPVMADVPFEKYAAPGSKFVEEFERISEAEVMNMHVDEAFQKKVSSKEMEKEIKLAIKMHGKYLKQPGSSHLHAGVQAAMWNLLAALRASVGATAVEAPVAESEPIDEMATARSTLKKYEALKTKKMWTKQEILGVAHWMSGIDRGFKQDADEEIKYILHELLAIFEEGKTIDIEPAQSKQGIDWLRKNVLNKNGELRDTGMVRDAGFTEKEANIIKDFKKFELVGFDHDEQYHVYAPIYRTIAKNGDHFDYSVSGGFGGAAITLNPGA